ncbi:S-adenosyl-L-methionine-dependent methyltransferase [Lophiostoma macrostomum CBS 122681]|uniref:S-adenosyl-L-methionine-dependent methyltransferase n=1 Tax=Lophiostoma macrostomum CBS 122681 TaxID=1314788 RepID=A0A6A6T9M6_9PLEO|nr:S-adenosyl-L-methionine-dependent methyltransferase [Lophiostoma macrostomum CBS 122681]
MATPFTPKQAHKFDGALLAKLQGNVSEQIARQILELIPPIAPTSKIHDNGCGYGSVTNEILASPSTPKDIQITATDINAALFTPLAERAEKEKLPVEVKQMDACELTLPDATFDLSISNFCFPGFKEPVKGAAHIKRILKPGGRAAVTVWDDIPWRELLVETHRKVRGADAPPPPFLIDNCPTERLRDILKEAGWQGVEYVTRSGWLSVEDLREWASLAWSFLGHPPGGWTPKDEEVWDEAIEIIVKGLDGICVEDGAGGWKCEMFATVAVWAKEA